MKTIMKSLLLAGLLIILSRQVLAQPIYFAYDASSKTSLFSDGFDNNSNQWITDNLWVSGKMESGYYDITCKNYQFSTGISPCKAFNMPAGSDFEIETAIKVIKGTGALIFGMTDKYDHYRVELTDKNTLEILKDTPSKKKKVEKIFTGIGNFLITKDYNKLTLRCVSGVYYIFANEAPVGQFISIKPEGNQIGFNVGTESEISVDYLKVTELKKKEVPIVAQNVQTQTIPAPVTTTTTANKTAPQADANRSNVTPPAPAAPSAPVITWTSPSGLKTTLGSFNATVKATIKSSSGLKSVLLYMNGVSKGETDIKLVPNEPGTFQIEKNLNFGPGENQIYLVATNSEGATKSEQRYLTNPFAVAPDVSWLNPTTPNTLVNTELFTLEASVRSPGDLRSLKLIVNGETQLEDNVFQPSSTDNSIYNWQSSVILKKGENSIYISATNSAGTKISEQRVIKYEAAMTEKRLALVFGNSQYKLGTPLKNPENDANLMEATLKQLGFDVIKRLNATKAQMEVAIREFTEKLPNYNVALFYYAGHGNQVDGKNYLIPTDALLEKPTDCKFEAISVSFVVDEFERYPDNTNIVILDACRNNPYANWARGTGDAGFRAVTFTSGTIIAFATSEGATAADGKGDNGLYTEELVKQMVIPQSLHSVFVNTRVQVKKLSNNAQVPMEWDKLNADYYLAK
jgi:hypothetical protein